MAYGVGELIGPFRTDNDSWAELRSINNVFNQVALGTPTGFIGGGVFGPQATNTQECLRVAISSHCHRGRRSCWTWRAFGDEL